MGTMDSYSTHSHSPSSCPAPDVVVSSNSPSTSTRSNSPTVPTNVGIQFPARPCSDTASTDEDEDDDESASGTSTSTSASSIGDGDGDGYGDSALTPCDCDDCETATSIVSTTTTSNSNSNSNPDKYDGDGNGRSTAATRISVNSSSSNSSSSSTGTSAAAAAAASASVVFSKSSRVVSKSMSKSKAKADRLKNIANPSDVDKLMLEELQGLSVIDRGLVQEEIHGVSTCAVSEDDERTIQEGLQQFEEQIRSVRREILASPLQPQESRLGNTYDESIWSYLIAVEEEEEDKGSSASVSAAATANRRMRLLYSYIFHRDFRLKFLRADLYDAEKAAHRYLRCLECLLKYFGTYALQRPLMYDDLGKECQDAAKAGYVQILPSRDRAGRLVVVSQAANTISNDMATIVKLFTYIFLVVSEDVETQKRGVIFVFSTNEEAMQVMSDPTDRAEYSLYREGSPVRRSCTHFCLPENNPKMRIVRAVMMLAMAREERVRTRIHMDGLTMETQYKLMTFGIPVSQLPITSTGAIKTKHHVQWIKTRKAIDTSRMKALEECYNQKIRQQQQKDHTRTCNDCNQIQPQASSSSTGAAPVAVAVDFCTYPTYEEFLTHKGKEPIIHPMINDVLFSKGGKNVTHYGNIEFTDLMKRSLMEYVSGTPVQNRKMRKAIREAIVEEVQSRGGRFLSLDKKLPAGCWWTEIVEGPDLHDRIATSLYDHKRRLAAKLKVKTNRCCGTSIFSGIDYSKRRKVINDDGKPIPVGLFCTHGHGCNNGHV